MTHTYGACDLLMITLPSTLTTVDLQHGYRFAGPPNGSPSLWRFRNPVWIPRDIVDGVRIGSVAGFLLPAFRQVDLTQPARTAL